MGECARAVRRRRRASPRSPPVCGAREELVAAAFSNEKLRIRRIMLDLLPQPINMRLKRVSCHVGIVAPDVLEQGLPGYRLLLGAMEIAKNCGLFFGQPQFYALRIDEVLRGRPKRIRADLKLRVLARLILTQLRT